ncbi:hypothetical protein BgiBS90_019640, partial [Biomphalaria glabrata]
ARESVSRVYPTIFGLSACIVMCPFLPPPFSCHDPLVKSDRAEVTDRGLVYLWVNEVTGATTQ